MQVLCVCVFIQYYTIIIIQIQYFGNILQAYGI